MGEKSPEGEDRDKINREIIKEFLWDGNYLEPEHKRINFQQEEEVRFICMGGKNGVHEGRLFVSVIGIWGDSFLFVK